MRKVFYFDTSIWLDFLENRNEPNIPKGRWVQELVSRIIQSGHKIVYSDLNIIELKTVFSILIECDISNGSPFYKKYSF